MQKCLIYVMLFGLAFVPRLAALASYQFDRWQTDEGLPQSTVTSIAQTPDGYLWLGTQNGLVRFDGINFKVFNRNNTPVIRNDRIVQLFVDRFGTLWVSGEEGELLCLQAGCFKYYPVPGKGTPFNYARRMCDDAEGGLWLVSCEWQLIRFRAGEFDMPAVPWNLRGAEPDGVASDKSGGIWLHTEQGLGRWENGAFQWMCEETNEGNFHVEVAAGRKDGLWVASNHRLRKFEAGHWVEDLGPFAWGDFWIYDLYEDSRGQVWVATMGGGLYCYAADGTLVHLTSRDGLPSDFVRCVTEDREGNLWVGMENGGLCRLKAVTFQSLGIRQGLASDHVTSMCESTNRSFWIAMDGDGVDKLSSAGAVDHYGSGQGLMNGHVWAVLEDQQGGVWAGTWDGLYHRSGSGRFVDLSDGLSIGRQIFSIYQDRENHVWIGQQGFGGLTRIQGDGRTLVRIPDSSPSLDVRAMVEDFVGGFWVGTENDGLYCLQAGRWTQYSGKEGLGSETVWSLLADEDGSIWIGTCGGGLSRLKNGKLSTWTTKNGLINDVICQILEDDHDNLWLGSYGGVFRVSKSELASGAANQVIRCAGYDKTDGLPSIQCVGGCQPSGFRSQDGRLWFPTVKGFTMVNPNAVPHNPLMPPVIIEGVTVDGIPLLPPENSVGTGGSNEVVKVPPGRQRIEFRYTALSLTNPGKVRFKYRLEGIETDWTDAGAKRVANYSYIPPGHYKFHVIAGNNDGVWNNAGDSLAITLMPYFWQTTSFLCLVVVAALGSVAGSVRYVVKRKMQRKIELVERERAIETERRRIANDIHDDLGAGLTEIVILTELAQNPGETYDAVQSDVRNVTDKARALTHSLDEIVWAVNPENDTLDSFVSYACNFAQNYLQSCRLRCRLAVPAQIPNVSLTADVRHNFFMALKEALNNIVKHAGASEVSIQIVVGAAEFAIVVADNGNGLPIEPKPEGPAGLNGESAGLGAGRNGLANMRKRMQSIGGRVKWESQPGHGTRVELTFYLCD